MTFNSSLNGRINGVGVRTSAMSLRGLQFDFRPLLNRTNDKKKTNGTASFLDGQHLEDRARTNPLVGIHKKE